MTLQRLQLFNFRNFQELDWSPSPSLNILEGENAQGKTNLLEAIYALAQGKSFRSQDLAGLVAFGEREARIGGFFTHRDLAYEASFRFSASEKELKLQGKTIHRFQKIQNLFRVLLFVPESTSLFRASAETRRRYFDQAIARHSASYNTLLLRYVRVVRQRNRLLEMRASSDLLEPFNQQWCELAVLITLERFEYLKSLLPAWQRRLGQFAADCGKFEVQWKTSVGVEKKYPGLSSQNSHAAAGGESQEMNLPKLSELQEHFYQNLHERFLEEQRRAYTLSGPHRDDLLVFLDGRLAREIASQGQQRMLVIALKLAEADLILERFGSAPIFLLDDIGSELDHEHSKALLESLQQIHAQTFLTTAQVGAFRTLEASIFQIKNGRLS